VKEQVRLLNDSQISLAVAFAQLKAARTNREIGNVLTDKKSFALVGIPEGVVGKINQRIGNVSTTNGASAAVGVFDKDVDMRGFFMRAEPDRCEGKRDILTSASGGADRQRERHIFARK
jgi:hypothetical protein